MTEHTLQLEIIGFFRNEYERKGLGVIIPVPNELARKRKDVVICLGCSDLIMVLKNKVMFCELKVGNNSQQLNQKEFESKVKKLGFEYIVVKSLSDFENLCLRQ